MGGWVSVGRGQRGGRVAELTAVLEEAPLSQDAELVDEALVDAGAGRDAAAREFVHTVLGEGGL